MPDEKTARKMTRGTSFILISRGMDGIISVVFSIIIARMLTPDIYGIVGASLGIAGFINLAGTLGVSFAVTKHVSSGNAQNDTDRVRATMRATLALQLILGIASAVVCYCMSDTLAASVFQKPQISILLKTLAVFVFTSAIVNWLLALFQGFHRMEFVAISDVIGISTRLGVAVCLVMLGYGAAGAVMGFLAGSMVTAAVGTALSVYYIISRIPDERKTGTHSSKSQTKTEMVNALRYGLPMVASAAVVLVYELAGTLTLMRWRSVAEVSWFSIAFGIVMILMVLPQSANASLLPIISGMHARNDSRGISRAYQKSIKFLLYITNILVFSLLVFSAQIIFILYGESYLPALAPLLIIAMAGFIRPLSVLSESVSAGMGRPGINTKANTLTAVLAVALCIILVPRYGVIGAASAILSAYLIGMGLLVALVLRLSRTDFPSGPVAKSLAAGALSAAAMLAVLKILLLLPFSGLAALLAYVVVSFAIGIALYLVALSLLGCFEKDDIQIIKNAGVPLAGRVSGIIGRLSKD